MDGILKRCTDFVLKFVAGRGAEQNLLEIPPGQQQWLSVPLEVDSQ